MLPYLVSAPDWDDVSDWLAGGVALALGAQALVRDTINGTFILFEDQYRKGDVVRIAEITGTIEEITLRRTIIRDDDGVLHSIPNGTISVVSNFTRDYAQVNLEVRVAYGEDLSRVADVIDRVGRELASDAHYKPLISEAPRTARVESVGDAGVAVTVTCRTKPAARWEVAAELRRRLIDPFLPQGVPLPPLRPVLVRLARPPRQQAAVLGPHVDPALRQPLRHVHPLEHPLGGVAALHAPRPGATGAPRLGHRLLGAGADVGVAAHV